MSRVASLVRQPASVYCILYLAIKSPCCFNTPLPHQYNTCIASAATSLPRPRTPAAIREAIIAERSALAARRIPAQSVGIRKVVKSAASGKTYSVHEECRRDAHLSRTLGRESVGG